MEEFREIIISSIKKIKEKDVAVLLSGGLASHSVLYAAIELGKNVHAYTFHLGGVESTDLKKARETCKNNNILHTAIVLPKEIETLKADTLFLINDIGCRLKTDIECSFPIYHSLKQIKEKAILSALGDDVYFGLTKRAAIHYSQNLDKMNEYRNNRFEKAKNQLKLMQTIGDIYDKELRTPYLEEELLEYFQSLTFEEINKPQKKQIIIDNFPELAGYKQYRHSFQLGDSGIAKHFEQLVNTDWNLRDYKTPTGIYNSIARGEIKEEKL